MKSLAYDKLTRIVYGCCDGNDLIYIGSSRCSINTVRYNHFHWQEKYGPKGRTHFRSVLVSGIIKEPSFIILKKLEQSTQQEIETLEGELIRLLRPKFNHDLDPVLSSKEHLRY